MAEAGCETSVFVGLHSPREQLTWLSSYLREAAISIEWFPGLASRRSSPSKKNLAKTIARDKLVSSLNVLANIMNTGII